LYREILKNTGLKARATEHEEGTSGLDPSCELLYGDGDGGVSSEADAEKEKQGI